MRSQTSLNTTLLEILPSFFQLNQPLMKDQRDEKPNLF